MLDLFTKLAETTSLINKKALLRQADSPLLRKILFAALDPFTTYGITQDGITMPKNHKGTYSLKDPYAWAVLDHLSNRDVTGTAAKKAVEETLGLLDPNDAEVFYRIIGRDLRCSVGTTMVNQIWKNMIPLFEVMLAKPADKHDVKWPAFGEPKFDGMRAIYSKKDGQFFSRNGLHIPAVDHLAPEAEKVIGEYDYLDGELVTDGSFHDAIGDLKRKGVKAEKAVFKVFEALKEKTFKGESQVPHYVRREYLEKLKFSNTIQLVPTTLLSNQAEADEFCAAVWGLGGEGIIIKDAQGIYEPKRSSAWLKVKKFETIDLPVVSYFEGKGKYKNQLGGLIASDGKITAEVGSGFSDEQRILLWQSRETIAGKVIEVGYHEVTPDNSLRHPRLIKFRPDKKVA